MNQDDKIRALLEHAARFVDADTDSAWNSFSGEDGRKPRSRMAMALVAACVAALVFAFLLQRSNSGTLVHPGTLNPSGVLAYGVRDPSGSRLDTLDIETGSATPLLEDRPTAAAWSPDGSQLVVVSSSENEQRATLTLFDGVSDEKVLVEIIKTDLTLPGPDIVSVSWAPDGRRIAYSGRTFGRGRTVSIINADGTGERVLDGHWESVSWHPDGDSLLLMGWPSGKPGGQPDLYVMRDDNGQVRRLTSDPMVEYHATWSPDGRRVAFARARSLGSENIDVFLLSLNYGSVTSVVDGSGFDGVPVWSPDGEWIAFASDRDSSPPSETETAIYVTRPDGTDLRLLLDPDTSAAFPLCWRAAHLTARM
jgi:Tol biopolymer transport system component